ncbi:MAG: M1 family aminopeptidase [Terriglobales bacterium]
MHILRYRFGQWVSRFAGILLLFGLALPAGAAEKPRLRVDDYVIDATVVPSTHKLTARAQVRFTALDDLATATFELHNALRLTRVADAAGHQLSAERVTQDSTVRVALPAGLQNGQSTTLTFDYEGVLDSPDDSPVPGLNLAKIGPDGAYLLYAGRWFPVVGYGTNRFTATISITVPQGFTVVGSGTETPGKPNAVAVLMDPVPQTRGRKAKPQKRPTPPPPAPGVPVPSIPGGRTFTFAWNKPSFPGTIIIGKFVPASFDEGGLRVHVYFPESRKEQIQPYRETAVKAFQFFTLQYGLPMSNVLKVVALPDDTVNSAWAPEIAAIAMRTISEKVNYRLLANTIAHQWWGATVSPASKDDWWLSDGFARFSEARYVESVAGQAGYQEVVKDMSVGALAYDTIPLSRVGTLDPFSPEFQSLTTDKGGAILNMLRWVIGDQAFDKALREFATAYAGKSATVDDFQRVTEQASGQQLAWFFTQWLDSTGAPAFRNKYTVFRTAKGFRVVGEISQDLDLFRMPVDLRIDTDGRTEVKRIEVVGTNSPYTVETFGKPRRITIDPDERVLENSPDLKLRTAILRGQQLVQQGDLAEALREFQKALDVNRNSSLAHYRIADVFFFQRNYQAAANEYREALNGDGEPKWTEVWSHIQLGKIFDVTGQRERAVNEYRQAVQTQDNTQGAQEEARKYLQNPYTRERATASNGR